MKTHITTTTVLSSLQQHIAPICGGGRPRRCRYCSGYHPKIGGQTSHTGGEEKKEEIDKDYEENEASSQAHSSTEDSKEDSEEEASSEEPASEDDSKDDENGD